MADIRVLKAAELIIARFEPGDHVIPLPGSSKATRTSENFAAANVVLTPEEKKELDDAVASFVVVGDRYPEQLQGDLLK